MRYYAVLGAENAPHIIAEFVRRSEAVEFDVVDSYSEAEMQQHPLLIAALERWRSGDDTQSARAGIAELLNASDLYSHLDGAVRTLRLYEDDLSTLPDEPSTVLARDVQAALEELLPRLEALRVEMPYTRWDEPRARDGAGERATGEGDARRGGARQRRGVTTRQGVSGCFGGAASRGRPFAFKVRRIPSI